MFELVIPEKEYFNDKTQEFVVIKGQKLQLEHSLVSLSKWESKWHKAFLSKENKTDEEMLDYIRCMTITKGVDPDTYKNLSNKQIQEVIAYIEEPMTATWFNEQQAKGPKRVDEVVTSELIYYWMIALQIPVEFQRWHLNRLLTLIRVCNLKNAPPKKMSKKEIMNRNRALNAKRKSAMNTRG